MAEQKKMVEEITSMEEDFAKWYTDVVKKAELASLFLRARLHGGATLRHGAVGEYPR